MFNLLFTLLFSFSCAKNNAVDSSTSSITETAVEESPITWDDCSYRIGEHICNITLPSSQGGIWDLYENHGRPMIIDLSAEWCPVCVYSAPFAETFMQRWAEHDLLWITILMENDQGEAPGAIDLAEWEINHNVQDSILLSGSRDMIDAAALNGFPISGWPTFVILTDDLLIYYGVGGWSEELLEQKLMEMLVIGQ